MEMIISIEHGATLLPANSPVIGALRSAPMAEDGVSGPPLWPDFPPGWTPPGWTPPIAPPQTTVKAHRGKSATVIVAMVPRDASDGTSDPSYDEAVEKLLWYLVVG